jgi:hypothetical protein
MLLTRQQTDFLWRSSWLSLACALQALYNGHSHLLIVPTGIFTTSILYWGNPESRLYRKLDMTCVSIAFVYQFLSIENAAYAYWYYTLSLFAVCFYPLSHYYYNRGEYWKSTYSHATMHFIGWIANTILYSGCIRDCAERPRISS